MAKSVVAGILAAVGGLRVVVTPWQDMRNHVGPGERLFILPHLKVQEPVPWGQAQADLIQKVYDHVNAQTAPTNHCGGCRQCCITPYVKDGWLEKPSHTACQHCAETGCALY